METEAGTKYPEQYLFGRGAGSSGAVDIDMSVE